MTEQTDTTTEADPFAETATDPFADDPTAEAPPQEPEPTPEPPTPEQPDEPTIPDAPAPEPPAPEPPAPEPPQEPEPPAPPADPVPPDIPQVDREGQPVSGPLPTTEEDATASAPEEPPAMPPADQNAPLEAQEPPQTPAETQAQPEAPVAAPPTPTPAPSSDADNGSGSDSPKSIRHYKLLYQTGPTSFEVAGLTDGNGQPKESYVKLIDGEHYLEARNNEHAYKLAFHLVGAPRDGVTLWPVPKASFRPRMVAPAPPAPERERLVIS